MFSKNIINLAYCTIIKIPPKNSVQASTVPSIYKEDLNHTLGLTLSTPSLVFCYKVRTAEPNLETFMMIRLTTVFSNYLLVSLAIVAELFL